MLKSKISVWSYGYSEFAGFSNILEIIIIKFKIFFGECEGDRFSCSFLQEYFLKTL